MNYDDPKWVNFWTAHLLKPTDVKTMTETQNRLTLHELRIFRDIASKLANLISEEIGTRELHEELVEREKSAKGES